MKSSQNFFRKSSRLFSSNSIWSGIEERLNSIKSSAISLNVKSNCVRMLIVRSARSLAGGFCSVRSIILCHIRYAMHVMIWFVHIIIMYIYMQSMHTQDIYCVHSSRLSFFSPPNSRVLFFSSTFLPSSHPPHTAAKRGEPYTYCCCWIYWEEEKKRFF